MAEELDELDEEWVDDIVQTYVKAATQIVVAAIDAKVVSDADSIVELYSAAFGRIKELAEQT
jgi:hypothetical protein